MDLITTQFAPAICQRIDAAASTVYLCFYSAAAPKQNNNPSFKGVWDALWRAHDRGCVVRLLFDHHAGGLRYSKYVSQQVINFRAFPFQVRFISNKKKIHSKFAIFDNEFVYLGSHNLTPSGVSYNHETGLIFAHREIAIRLLNNFLYLWEQANVG